MRKNNSRIQRTLAWFFAFWSGGLIFRFKMSGAAARLPRPKNLSHLQKTDLYKNISYSVGFGLLAGLAYWYGPSKSYQRRFEEFTLWVLAVVLHLCSRCSESYLVIVLFVIFAGIMTPSRTLRECVNWVYFKEHHPMKSSKKWKLWRSSRRSLNKFTLLFHVYI